MQPDSNNLRLRLLMRDHGLSRSHAARLCMVRDPSLDRWLSPTLRNGGPNPQYRAMPDHRLALLTHALDTEIPAVTDADIAKQLGIPLSNTE